MSHSQAHPPTVDQQLAGAHTATENAQALAGHWQGVADAQRAEIDALMHANVTMYGRLERAEALAASEAVRALIHEAVNPSHDHWIEWVQRLQLAAARAAAGEGEKAAHQEEIDALKLELSSIEHAAHMPDDYAYGMPSWINQVLWASYIGADPSPHIKAEIDGLKQERRALCDVLSADCSTIAGQTLVEALKAIIGERDEERGYLRSVRGYIDRIHEELWQAKRVLIPIDTVLDQPPPPLCPRCGRALDTVAPGVSVVAGGASVCTPCLRRGETEIARARGLR